MRMDDYQETMDACRFCFMCRHLSPVGNVTFRESDTPRGRALLAGKMRQSMDNANAEYVDAFYKAELSAACRYHCVSHYDEAGLVLAVRQDIVQAGLAPENVKALARELQDVDFAVEGAGEVLYYVDPYGDKRNAPAGCMTISGGDAGKALQVLGYADESANVSAKFAAAVKDSGCRKIVTSCPASHEMFKCTLKDVEVLHASEFITGRKGSGEVYYLESDYLKNYQSGLQSPGALLERLGYTVKPFGTNPEESYTAGEGAVVYDRLYPDIAQKLCARIAGLADDPQADVLVTASPYTKTVLNRYEPQLTVRLIDEILDGGL